MNLYLFLFAVLATYPRATQSFFLSDRIFRKTCPRRTTNVNLLVQGPSLETKPNYETIHGPLGKTVDELFLVIFRRKMADKFGFDSNYPQSDYKGLMELADALNARYSEKRIVQALAQDVLRSLFPSWLPKSFSILFSKPFPKFSSRLNAWATQVAGTWLMGECVVNDCYIDGGGIGINQGLLVKRCRFLEESACASICVHACKIPTQNFFRDDMGLSLTMTPNYDTGECQFSFGLTPTKEEEMKAKKTPCLARCPSVKSLNMPSVGQMIPKENGTDESSRTKIVQGNLCDLME